MLIGMVVYKTTKFVVKKIEEHRSGNDTSNN